MTWYGVFVVLFISVCFTTNIKAQELVIASSGPGNCAGMERGYIAFYRCMLQCFQDDLGYDGFVESDFCSGNVQVAIFQGDGADTFTIDDLKEALQCVTGRCRSVIPPSVCQDSIPQIISLPDDIKKEVMSGIESGKYKNISRSESEKKKGSSGLKLGQLDNSGLQRQISPLDASGLLSEVLKISGIQPGQLVVSGQPGQLDGFGTQTSGLDASGLLSKVLKASGLQPGQAADVSGLPPGQLVVSGLPPGQLVVSGQPGQLVVSGQPGQLDGLGTQTSGLDASGLLLKILKASGLQPGELVVSKQSGQLDGSGTQTQQLDASELLSKVLKTSGIQPGQSDASDLLLKLLDGSGVLTGKFDALGLQPDQGVDVSGIQPGQSVAVSGPQSKILASISGPQSKILVFTSAPGDSIDDCDDYQTDAYSNNPTEDSSSTPTSSATTSSSASGATPASSPTGTNSDSSTSGTTPATTSSEASGSSAGSSASSETVSTFSTDSTSDVSADDCEEYDSSLYNFDENSNSFNANGNSFQSAVAVASVNGDAIDFSNDYDYAIGNCTYFYDDYNGTFSNCSFFNESNSSYYTSSDYDYNNSNYYTSSDYDYDNTSNFSNYDSSSAFTEAQIINQNSGIQQSQSNNEGAISVSVGNGQNQGQFANAAVFNQNPTIQQYQATDQNIGVAPSGSSQGQGLFVNIPAQNQGPTIQQFQNNNGFRDLNSQNFGQFGNAPVVAQSLNQGQLQSTFSQIQGSKIPAVQQYQSNNNGGGIAIGSGQNQNQFINSFLQSQGFNQNPAVTQYGNGFLANQQYPVQIAGAGNGGSGSTQGQSPNIQQTQAVVGNFGSLPQFNSAQNNANIQQFNGGSNNPASASNTAASNAGIGIESSGQTQGSALNFPAPGQNNFGNVPQFNFGPNNGNVQQFNGGGSNLASSVANSAAGIGGLSQTLGGLNSNLPAGTNIGSGLSLNFQQNSGNVPLYNGGGNNPGVNSAVAGSGFSSQIQSSLMNVPVQGPALTGSNFGGGSSFNSFQYSNNAPQINGGVGQNANGAAINSFVSNGSPAGILTRPGVSVNSQPLVGSVPFSQGSASAFGSAANAQAQASAG